MKAAVLYRPERIILEERGIPELQPGEVLVRVRYAGICGSDVSVYYGKHPQFPTGPVIPGHEFSGEVAEIRLNVKICGAASGLTLGYAGPSHHAIEDIAIMRALPNITVVSPADSLETKQMVRAIAYYHGPVYLRLSRLSIKPIYDDNYEFKLGKAVVLREGKDATLFATGDMVVKSLGAADLLLKKGIEVEVVNIHTIKPIDADTVTRSAQKTGAVVTVEDHNIIGGLGGAIAEVLVENVPVPMQRIGIVDTFTESADTEILREAYGLNVEAIIQAVETVIKRKGRQSGRRIA